MLSLESLFPYLFFVNDDFKSYNKFVDNSDIHNFYMYKNDYVYKYKRHYDEHENVLHFTSNKYMITNKIWKYLEYRAQNINVRYIPLINLFDVNERAKPYQFIENAVVVTNGTDNFNMFDANNIENFYINNEIDIIERRFGPIYIKPAIFTLRKDLANDFLQKINPRINQIHLNEDHPDFIADICADTYFFNSTIPDDDNSICLLSVILYDINQTHNYVWFKHNNVTNKYFQSILKIFDVESSKVKYYKNDNLYVWNFDPKDYFVKQYNLQKVCCNYINNFDVDLFENYSNEDEIINKIKEDM